MYTYVTQFFGVQLRYVLVMHAHARKNVDLEKRHRYYRYCIQQNPCAAVANAVQDNCNLKKA